MPVLPMKEIQCRHCGRQTRHLTSALAGLFRRPAESTRPAQQIDYACPECMHVGPADVPERDTIFDFPDHKQLRDAPTVCLIAAECAESKCRSRVIVLVPAKVGADVPHLREQMTRWIADGARPSRSFLPE